MICLKILNALDKDGIVLSGKLDGGAYFKEEDQLFTLAQLCNVLWEYAQQCVYVHMFCGFRDGL